MISWSFHVFFTVESDLNLPFLAFSFSKKPVFHDQKGEMTTSESLSDAKFSREISEKKAL